MRVSENSGDVRFFGAHDRAWIPLKDIFMYSEKPPIEIKKKRTNIEGSFDEVEKHRKKLEERFGRVEYADHKTPYDPSRELEMLRIMLPNYEPPFDIGQVARRSRSYSCSGSEKSRDATPTPSEMMEDDDDASSTKSSIVSRETVDTPQPPTTLTASASGGGADDVVGEDSLKEEDKFSRINPVTAAPEEEASSAPSQPKYQPIKVKINTKLATVLSNSSSESTAVPLSSNSPLPADNTVDTKDDSKPLKDAEESIKSKRNDRKSTDSVDEKKKKFCESLDDGEKYEGKDFLVSSESCSAINVYILLSLFM